MARAEAVSQPRNKKSQGFEGDRRVDRIRHLLENGFHDDQVRDCSMIDSVRSLMMVS